MIWLLILGFVLFVLHDWNDYRLSSKMLRLSFPLGCLLVGISTIASCIQGQAEYSFFIRVIGGIGVLLFLVLMLYSLFWALPVKEAYVETETGRSAYTDGVYALCRHPGVLWFILLYVSLHFAFGLHYVFAGLASVLNILLVLYEDLVIFPKVLEGYTEYKKRTPFLLPTGNSIRRCIDYYRKG